MSKAKDDFPDPETPVITTNFLLGMATSTFFKCACVPFTRIKSLVFSDVIFGIKYAVFDAKVAKLAIYHLDIK